MLETYGIVLDFLPKGRVGDVRQRALVQLIGTTNFTLLEAVPRAEITQLPIGEKVYVGKDKRDVIERIIGRISYDQLTSVAKTELPVTIEKIVREKEKEFVDFFNRAGAVNIRLHSLELLPGIGKKHMTDILAEREKAPFTSFEDISKRVELLPNPVRLISERIEREIKNEDKYYLFVRPPRRDETHR